MTVSGSQKYSKSMRSADCFSNLSLTQPRQHTTADAMNRGRRSGESLNRSRFSACSATGQAGIIEGHRGSNGNTNNAGGGILSFLKTEIDSFVKGLSGKADVSIARWNEVTS